VCVVVDGIRDWVKDEPTLLILVWVVLFIAYVMGLGTIFLKGA
jgi:hypothetical protein